MVVAVVSVGVVVVQSVVLRQVSGPLYPAVLVLAACRIETCTWGYLRPDCQVRKVGTFLRHDLHDRTVLGSYYLCPG